MANCADCGRNPKRGCLPECPRDKTRSVWARYRARKKAKQQATEDIRQNIAAAIVLGNHRFKEPEWKY